MPGRPKCRSQILRISGGKKPQERLHACAHPSRPRDASFWGKSTAGHFRIIRGKISHVWKNCNTKEQTLSLYVFVCDRYKKMKKNWKKKKHQKFSKIQQLKVRFNFCSLMTSAEIQQIQNIKHSFYRRKWKVWIFSRERRDLYCQYVSICDVWPGATPPPSSGNLLGGPDLT